MSRRPRASAALVLAAAVAVVLSACSSAPTASPTDTAPVSGGSLTYGVETEPITLNPQLNGQDKARVTLRNAYDNLFSVSDTGQVLPWLATGYTISEDARTYTITLRDGVTFWDGEKWDAAALKTNLEKSVDPEYNPFGAAGPFSHIGQIATPDARTVVVTLSEPYAPFLITLANLPIISPAAYRNADVKSGGPDVAGSGPFILKSYTKGQQAVFEKNPAYDWAPATAAHGGPAYLDTVTVRFLPEASVRTNALLSGQVDVIEGVPGTSAAQFQGKDSFGYLTALNTGTPYSLYFNTTVSPTSDVRVRKAFRDAVDLDAVLTSVYQGQRTRAWSAVSPQDPSFYDRTLEGTYGNDAAAANALLDQAGWTGPRTPEGYRTNAAGEVLRIPVYQSQPFVRDSRDVLLQAIQAQAKQNAGIFFDVQLVDEGTAQQHQQAADYAAYDNSNTDPDGVDLEYHWLPASEGGFINLSLAEDPQLGQWLAAGRATPDVAVRATAYAALQQYVVAEQAYSFPLFEPEDQIASSSRVHGLGFRSYFQIPESVYDVWIAPR